MKYYRVDSVLDRNLEYSSFVVQQRKWGIWRTLCEYSDRGEAFMHLDSLNRYELLQREQFWTQAIDKLKEKFGR